jgi:hypothetical protein
MNEHQLLTGWVATDGTFYPCRDCQHEDTLYALDKKTESSASVRGYLHVGFILGLYLVGGEVDRSLKPTYQQQKTIDAILAHACDKLKHHIYAFLEEMEG